MVLIWRNGAVTEQGFATRTEAEIFIHTIPEMQREGQSTDIYKAYLRPALFSIN